MQEKVTTDLNGGVPPLGERLDAWDELAGARRDAVAAEARCKVCACIRNRGMRQTGNDLVQ